MSALDAVVIGESLVDIVESASGRVEKPGGSPFNVAIGLARLGHPVALLTSIGDDDRGATLREHLEADSVEVLPASFGAGPTSTAEARLAADGSASYRFAIEWDLVTPVELPAAPVLHTGSIATFLLPGAARVTEVLRAEHGRRLVSFDPNIRPSLIAADAAEEVRRRVAENVALSAVVKLSDEDAAWLWPGSPADEVLDRLLAGGAGLAAITRGGDGSMLATARDRVELPAPRVDVVDTIGAGDSYMAGLLAGLIGLPEEVRARLSSGDASPLGQIELRAIGGFAARCAAITVSRAGANPPSRAEVGTA